MALDESVNVRCSKQLRQAIKDWCKTHHCKEGELIRKVLERAFEVEEEPMPLPPGFAKIRQLKEPQQQA